MGIIEDCPVCGDPVGIYRNDHGDYCVKCCNCWISTSDSPDLTEVIMEWNYSYSIYRIVAALKKELKSFDECSKLHGVLVAANELKAGIELIAEKYEHDGILSVQT